MKIIDPLINADINFTKKGFFISRSYHTKLLPTESTEELVDFAVEPPRSSNTFWIKQNWMLPYHLLQPVADLQKKLKERFLR